MQNKYWPDPLRFTLMVLAAIVLFASIGLALDGNWPKLVRVTLAAVAYLGPLAAWSSYPFPRDTPPWWLFAGAGGLAGLVSGLLQPVFSLAVILMQIAGASLLLGTVHWLALRYGRAVRQRPDAPCSP
jgi:hypothetical protein